MGEQHNKAHARLHTLLTDEAALLDSFVELLTREEAVLTQGNPDTLLPLAEEKNRLYARLAEFAEARNTILADAGLPPDRVGMEGWLAIAQQKPDLRHPWEKVLRLAAKASAMNQTNGTLISVRLAHNNQALQVLLSAANQTSVYGPDGQAKATGIGRHLGSG